MAKVPANVDEYIADAPDWAQGILKELRRAITGAAPDAQEKISYRMPYYSLNGRLAYFAVHKDHCGFYWISDEDKEAFAKELALVKVEGSTLQIHKGAKVPVSLIKKIIKMRVKSNAAKVKS